MKPIWWQTTSAVHNQHVEEGLDALLHLSTSEDLEDVTGEFFDGKSRSRTLSQAYDREAGEKLKNITEDIPAEFI